MWALARIGDAGAPGLGDEKARLFAACARTDPGRRYVEKAVEEGLGALERIGRDPEDVANREFALDWVAKLWSEEAISRVRRALETKGRKGWSTEFMARRLEKAAGEVAVREMLATRDPIGTATASPADDENVARAGGVLRARIAQQRKRREERG